jgi:hypothetical protein
MRSRWWSHSPQGALGTGPRRREGWEDQVGGAVDKARHFLSAQYDGDLASEEFGKGQIIARDAPFQDLVEQEPQRGCMHRDCPGVNLPLRQKVQLIFPHVLYFRSLKRKNGWLFPSQQTRRVDPITD